MIDRTHQVWDTDDMVYVVLSSRVLNEGGSMTVHHALVLESRNVLYNASECVNEYESLIRVWEEDAGRQRVA